MVFRDIPAKSCILDAAALFRWPGVSPDPGPSPATGEKPGWAAATYNLPFPLEAPVNPGPVTPPSLPPLQGFLHIRVSNSVLYLLGGPGADSTLTTTLTPTELGPTQANPGTPHQGVHPRHIFTPDERCLHASSSSSHFAVQSPPGRPQHDLRPQRSCPTMQHTSPSYTHDMSHHTFTLPHKSSTKHPCTPGADTQQRAHYTQHTRRVHRSTAYCAL